MALNTQKIDKQFRLLGLTRGCSEEDVKKAYHQKALAFHPDRNPQGAEAFKEVNMAYECLKEYFERFSGKKFRGSASPLRGPFPMSSPSAAAASSGGASGSPHTSNTSYPSFFASKRGGGATAPNGGGGASHAPPPPPRFSDEELFGNAVPGGFMREKSSTSGGPFSPTGRPSATATTENDEHWRRAHGSRVPVSGYSEGTPLHATGGTAFSSASLPQYARQHPEGTVPSTNGRNGSGGAYRSASGFSSVPNSFDELKSTIQDLFAKTAYVQSSSWTNFPRSEREELELFKENRIHAIWALIRPILNEDDRRRVLRHEWEQLKSEWNERAEMAQKVETEKEEGREREAARQQALVEERRRLQAIEEAARRVREERQVKAKLAAEELASAIRLEKDEQQQDYLLDDKRRLLKMMFRLQYSPDPADVGDMTDVEVFILSELVNDIAGKMKGVLNARLLRGPCSRCRMAPKVAAETVKPVFTCSHACVCETCAERASQCPMCGAARTVPVLPVVPPPPPPRNISVPQEGIPATCSLPDVSVVSGGTRSPSWNPKESELKA